VYADAAAYPAYSLSGGYRRVDCSGSGGSNIVNWRIPTGQPSPKSVRARFYLYDQIPIFGTTGGDVGTLHRTATTGTDTYLQAVRVSASDSDGFYWAQQGLGTSSVPFAFNTDGFGLWEFDGTYVRLFYGQGSACVLCFQFSYPNVPIDTSSPGLWAPQQSDATKFHKIKFDGMISYDSIADRRNPKEFDVTGPSSFVAATPTNDAWPNLSPGTGEAKRDDVDDLLTVEADFNATYLGDGASGLPRQSFPVNQAVPAYSDYLAVQCYIIGGPATSSKGTEWAAHQTDGTNNQEGITVTNNAALTAIAQAYFAEIFNTRPDGGAYASSNFGSPSNIEFGVKSQNHGSPATAQRLTAIWREVLGLGVAGWGPAIPWAEPPHDQMIYRPRTEVVAY
jgi:hypothetical protein